jgi:hypothetical protein
MGKEGHRMTKKARRGAHREKAPVDLVTVDLTDELAPLIRRHAEDCRALLILIAAPFWPLDEGQMRFRMQVKYLSWARARRVLEILHEEDDHPAADGGVEP